MKIIKKNKKKISKWLDLCQKDILINDKIESYHSFSLDNYVSIIAQKKNSEIILVKQFRPAIEKYTLELPGGIKDDKLSYSKCVIKELYEETGFLNTSKPKIININYCDVGRLSNKIYGFYVSANNFQCSKWIPESGIKVFFVSPSELYKLVKSEKLNHALHTQIILRAYDLGLIKKK
jgi:ADP-ribose pyrophosphatase